MMRLMISVVSTDEAGQALQGGAEILDIKNPAEGSLGAQSPGLIREISKLFSAEAEISAAIGDMPNLPGTAALAALGAAACGADYIKVGLYGARSETDAVILLREVQRAVMEFHTRVIAALYADCRRAGTLKPECLPRIAAEAGVHGCLLDTAIKDGRTLFDFQDPRALRLLAQQAHAAGLSFGLAGALREQDLSLANDLGADVVGLRTAACRNNQRNGPLEATRVKELCGRISGFTYIDLG
jgi:(5-formylfuran-3-yl)methyl phosphate synthase